MKLCRNSPFRIFIRVSITRLEEKCKEKKTFL